MVKQDCFNLLINRCSTLHKLKRLTARLLQFTSYLQHRVKGLSNTFTEHLSVQDIQTAERALIEVVQHKHFFECFNAINSKSKSANSLPRYLRKLQLIVIDGVLRVGGRLTQAPLDFDV